MTVLLDVSQTSRSDFNSGIQRVCRSLCRELAARGRGTCAVFDEYEDVWRAPTAREAAKVLAPVERLTMKNPGNRWSRTEKAAGWLRQVTGIRSRDLGKAARTFSGLVAPEIFYARVAQAYRRLDPLLAGPKVAVFHDTVAVKFPACVTPKTAARFPDYLEELLRFDGIAANSTTSRDDLLDYWERRRVACHPPVKAVPLGVGIGVNAGPPVRPAGAEPVILMVATLEARKNHLAFLEAAERLWSSGLCFTVKLIGALRSGSGRPAAARIAEMQGRRLPVVYLGAAGDEALAQAYGECSFTVYPSAYEGFGLPVLESLRFGRPCVCTPYGALGEISRAGGCLALDDDSPEAIAGGLRRLLTDRNLYGRLSEEARRRPIRSWSDYCDDLLAWMDALR